MWRERLAGGFGAKKVAHVAMPVLCRGLRHGSDRRKSVNLKPICTQDALDERNDHGAVNHLFVDHLVIAAFEPNLKSTGGLLG